MTVKNFKINTGLDLNGLVLEQGTGSSLVWNNDAIATEAYVDTAVGGVTVDPSGWAGYDLTWNSGTNQFDININSLGTDLLNGVFLDSGAQLQVFATQSYVTGQGYITSSALSEYVTSSTLSTTLNNYVTSESLDSTVGNYGYIKSSALSGYATESYVGSQGFITSSTEFVKSASAPLSVNSSGELSLTYSSNHFGVGSSNDLQINTTNIATRAYVDSIAQGLDVKASVKVASTGNIPDLTYVDSIDGVYLGNQDRVLLKNQTNPSENGIYVFTGAAGSAGSLDRAADATFDIALGTGTLTKGSFVFVESGTYAGKGYVVSNILPNANSFYEVTWTQFSETGNYISSVGSNLSVGDGTGGTTLGQLTVNLSSKQDAFTLGTGLTNESATTIGVDTSVVATLSDTQTLSNKTLSSPTITVGGYTVSATESDWYLDSGMGVYDVGLSGGRKAWDIDHAAATSFLSDGDYVSLYIPGNTTLNNVVWQVSGTPSYLGYQFATIHSTTALSDNQFSEVGSSSFEVRKLSGSTTTISSTELSYLDGVTSNIQTQLSAKQGTLTAGNGIAIDGSNNITVDLNDIAGTGITVNGNTLEAAPAYISSVDASFAVSGSGQLSLSDTISIASVELTDSVANVTASSDVFGNGSTSTYAMGSNQTVGTIPTGVEVADVFITLKDAAGNSRTSKMTAVFTGGDAPTWTEYGIITSGWSATTTVGFDSSKNIIVNVSGISNYSAKGVFTTIK